MVLSISPSVWAPLPSPLPAIPRLSLALLSNFINHGTHFSVLKPNMAAARNHQVLKHTIRLFSSRSGKEGIAGGSYGSSGGISTDELDESDVIWASSSPPRAAGLLPTWKNVGNEPDCPSMVGSLPVNIPVWSKLLRSGPRCQALDEEEDEDDGGILPPHEVVWRRRAESFSMMEGIGRTLKGRDLSRVRNAVWAQTGFQD